MDPFLQAAITEATAGLAEGGIPIGSVLVRQSCIRLMRRFVDGNPKVWDEDIGVP